MNERSDLVVWAEARFRTLPSIQRSFTRLPFFDKHTTTVQPCTTQKKIPFDYEAKQSVSNPGVFAMLST